MEVAGGLRDRALAVIGSGTVAGLATQSEVGPDVCAIFYVCLADGRLGFKSRRASQHMRNVKGNSSVALIAYSHESTYSVKLGVQLKGSVREAHSASEMAEIVAAYAVRFEGAAKKLGSAEELCLKSTESTFFICELGMFRLIDEDPHSNNTMVEYQAVVDWWVGNRQT
jgi:uncharacterized protein YhbP (UPF0306 family)